MSRQAIIRAWKDRKYRYSLSDAERAMLPESPVGLIELSNQDLDAAGVVANATPTCSSCTTYSVCCC